MPGAVADRPNFLDIVFGAMSGTEQQEFVASCDVVSSMGMSVWGCVQRLERQLLLHQSSPLRARSDALEEGCSRPSLAGCVMARNRYGKQDWVY
jgi:hypothetical protein